MSGKGLPVRASGGEGGPAAEQQARFLVGLPDGRKGDGPCAAGVAGSRAGKLRLFGRMETACNADAPVGGIGPPAGKDEAARQEGMALVPAPHEHAMLAVLPVDEDQRGRIARARWA